MKTFYSFFSLTNARSGANRKYLIGSANKLMAGILCIVFLSISIKQASAQFTSGRLVVLQVGDGSAALSSAGTPLFLKEYSTAGTPGASVTIPTTGGTALTSSGSATSEGMLSLSGDGHNLILQGYNVASGTAGVAGSSTSTAPIMQRGVGKVDACGNFTLAGITNSTTNYFTGNNIRGAASDGDINNNFWADGAATGICYMGAGTQAIVSTTSTNNRAMMVFNNNLYFSTGSGTKGIYQVGTNDPTTAGTTSTLIIPVNFTSNGSTASSVYGFAFGPGNSITTGSVCYFIDDNTAANKGGVRKATFNGSTWTISAYDICNTPGRGLVVDWSGYNSGTGAGAVIYFTTSTATSANPIMKVTDNGSTTATAVALATAVAAPTNTAFRGLAWAPVNNNQTYTQATLGVATSPLTFSTTNQAVFGFTVSNASVAASISGLVFPTTSNTNGVLTNLKLVKSVDNNFSTAGDNTTLTGLSFVQNAGNITVTGMTENLSVCSKASYFLVADITSSVTSSTPTLTVSLANANVTSTGSPLAFSFNGTTYSFAGATPSITPNPTSISFGTVAIPNAVTIPCTITGSNLTSSINISTNPPFSVSPTTLPATGGTVNVTFTPGSATTFSDNMTLTDATDGVTVQVPLDGIGVNSSLSFTGTIGAFGNQVINSGSGFQSVSISGTNLTSAVTVTAPPGFLISTSQCSGYSGSVVLAVAGSGNQQGGTLAATNIFVVFNPTATISYTSTLTATAGGTGATSAPALSGTGVLPTAFTSGNVVVYTIGTGVCALNSAASPVQLVEYTPTGTASGAVVAIPALSGSSLLTNSGSATSEEQLNLSPDQTQLSFGGYKALLGTAAVANSTSVSAPRSVGYVSNDGTFAEVINAADFTANNIRGAISDGACNKFWATGAAGGSFFFGNSAGTGTSNIEAAPANTRCIGIFNGQLYISTGSGTLGVYKLSTPFPTAAGTATSLFTYPAAGSPYDFAFSPGPFANGLVLYIADDGGSTFAATNAGVQKWTYNGTTWSSAYILKTGATTGASHIAVDWSNFNPTTGQGAVIYATTSNLTLNTLVKFADNGSGSTPTVLATATANKVFRGVALSPSATPIIPRPSVQDNNLHFTPITAGSMTVSWTNGNATGGHVAIINVLNDFTSPADGTSPTATTNYTHTGTSTLQQVVYNGTGNSVTVTGLNANQIYWVEVYGYNSNPTSCLSTAYNSNTAVDNPIPNVNVWTGAVSNAWTTAGNWNTGVVPTNNSCATNVLIPAISNPNFTPVISSAVSIGDVFMSDGALLTINGSNTLTACGNWIGGTSSNAIVNGNGMVILNGTSAQTISGKTNFQELQTANNVGVSIAASSSVDISGFLDLKLGNFNVTAGALTFKSTSVSQIGILDNFTAGNTGTLTGNVTAERYYDASQTQHQHFMGSPINSAPLLAFGASGIGGYVAPLGGCNEVQLQSTSPTGTVFSLHEDHGTSCGMEQWFVETSGNANNAQGYSIYKTGAGVLALTGSPNVAASYSLSGLTNTTWTNTSMQGRPMTSGWQLVGNPYLAYLNTATMSNTGMDVQVLVWNTEGTFAGTYQAQTTVAPFQAFMMHKTASGGGGGVTVNGTGRARTGSSQFMAMNDNELDITSTETASGLQDQTTIAFNSNASDQFDPQLDINKIAGSLGRHTLYTTINNSTWMSKNVLNSINTTSTVPMGFEPGVSGNHSFHFGGINSFDPTTYVTLEDKKLNVMYDVRTGDYNFTSDIADDWNRFVVHFTPPTVIASSNATCNAAGAINVTQPGTASWNYVLTDGGGATISSGVLNQTSPLSLQAQQGTYTLTLTDNNNYQVTKQITVAGEQNNIVAAFTVPNNTVTVQSNIQFTNTSQNGVNYSWNFGDGTIITGVSNPSYSYTQPGTYIVTLTVTNADGCTSTYTQTITVSAATAINKITDANGIGMWSNENKVYVDFSALQKVDATITMYNVLGQELCTDKFTLNGLYEKQISNIEAAYIIVKVTNGDSVNTKKLFITNNK